MVVKWLQFYFSSYHDISTLGGWSYVQVPSKPLHNPAAEITAAFCLTRSVT